MALFVWVFVGYSVVVFRDRTPAGTPARRARGRTAAAGQARQQIAWLAITGFARDLPGRLGDVRLLQADDRPAGQSARGERHRPAVDCGPTPIPRSACRATCSSCRCIVRCSSGSPPLTSCTASTSTGSASRWTRTRVCGSTAPTVTPTQARELRDALRRAVRPVPHLHVVAGQGRLGICLRRLGRGERRPRERRELGAGTDERDRIRPGDREPAGATGGASSFRASSRGWCWASSVRSWSRSSCTRSWQRRSPPSRRHGHRRLRRLVHLLPDRHRRRQLPGPVGPGRPEPTHEEELELAGKGQGVWRYFRFCTDHKVVGIQYLVTVLVLFAVGGPGLVDDPARAGAIGGEGVHARHLQHDRRDARARDDRDHDHHALRRVRQLLRADHDRRQRHGVPARERAQLLDAVQRGAGAALEHGAGWVSDRLDRLLAARRPGGRGHGRVLLHDHRLRPLDRGGRDEHVRHGAQDASAGDDLDQAAGVRLEQRCSRRCSGCSCSRRSRRRWC